MQGLVTVFGGSGFIGRHTVRALARAGWRVRVAIRNPNLVPELRVMGDVGQIELSQANVRVPASVDRALEGASACVNLVGVLHGHGRQSFEALHVAGSATIAAAAAQAGVERLIHVSAIGADPDSASKYARSKAAGEAAVRAAFARATVLRPSVVFGPEDDFFNRFAAMAAMGPVPLIGGGATRFQPVYAGDVGAAITAALTDTAAPGRIYELGGPGAYSFRQLMEITLKETCRKSLLLPIPFGIARLIGVAGDLAAGIGITPPVTSDQVELLKTDNLADHGLPGLAELGVAPTPLESELPNYLWRFRNGGQFAPPQAQGA